MNALPPADILGVPRAQAPQRRDRIELNFLLRRMLVDESDAETFAFGQVICCRSAEATGTNHDNIGLADQDAMPLEIG